MRTLMDRYPYAGWIGDRSGSGCRREIASSSGGLMAVTAIDAFLQAGLAGVRVVEPAHDQAVEPIDHSPPAIRDQLDFLDVARLEASRSAARQVETHAVRLDPVEDERLVGLEEVVM